MIRLPIIANQPAGTGKEAVGLTKGDLQTKWFGLGTHKDHYPRPAEKLALIFFNTRRV